MNSANQKRRNSCYPIKNRTIATTMNKIVYKTDYQPQAQIIFNHAPFRWGFPLWKLTDRNWLRRH